MSELTDRLERDLREIAADARPSQSAWDSIVARLGEDTESDVVVLLAPAPDRSKRPLWIAAAAALVVIAGSIAVFATRSGDDRATTNTAVPFVGRWASTDTDGSSQWMEIVDAAGGGYEVVARDAVATAACSGGASRLWGIGRLETPEKLVIAHPELSCDDGTTPAVGPPPQAELAGFTLELDVTTDKIVDSFGVVWQRSLVDLVDLPPLTTRFDSQRNGFTIKLPDRAALATAMDLWEPGNQHADAGVDVMRMGPGVVFKGASTAVTADVVSIDQWVDENVSPGGCGVPRSQQAEIIIDGQSGRVAECLNRIEATVVAGGRLYLFTLLDTRSDARAVFDTFIATIDLTPETAIDFPALTTTFVSPTNGFSFKYWNRGGDGSALAPAKALWEPGTWDPSKSQTDDGMDGVETGIGAYFNAASAPIPDGVSIDQWVDDAVSRGRCDVPYSQRAEITIDGQSGRIAECPREIDATVVAGGRLYLFTLLHGRSDARAFFNTWIVTIDLTPETAAVP